MDKKPYAKKPKPKKIPTKKGPMYKPLGKKY